MIVLGKIENRFIITLLSFFSISVLGILDYITGAEIASSIFYLLPIILVALNKNINRQIILANALYAAIIWYLADIYDKEYANNLIPVWNSFVRLSFFVIVGLLIFNLKEKYKKLAQLNSELVKLNAEKNKFIGIAAHDLRNPIGAIASYSELIISDYSNKIDRNILEMIKIINEISDNTLKLLKNLLDVSQIESGKIDISPKLQSYLEFIKKHIHLNQFLANKKGINIQFETTEKEINFCFDDKYLGEVIDNLLTNAIKFSFPQSKIIIRVSLTENNNIKTEVIDIGKGIRLDEQSKLFSYFQKTSTQPTANEQSTGLGLAIAKKIVTEHNGQIGLISEIDKGSNFYFELPIVL